MGSLKNEQQQESKVVDFVIAEMWKCGYFNDYFSDASFVLVNLESLKGM